MDEIITKRASSPLETSLLGISAAAFLGAIVLAGMKAGTLLSPNKDTIPQSAAAFASKFDKDLERTRDDLGLDE